MTERARVLIGRVLPMTGRGEFAEAVAWEGDEVVALGSETDVLAAAGDEAEVERVDGLIMPGFVDAHHHFSIAALHREAVDCWGVSDYEELQAVLRGAAETTPAGTWIYAVGYDEQELASREHPPLEVLDEALPDHPLCLVHYSCHSAVTNSAGLEAAGIDTRTPDPAGGRIERGRHGRPTGRLEETAMGLVEAKARESLLGRSGEEFFGRLEEYASELLASGITCIADPTVTPDFENIYHAASQEGRLPLRVVMMPVGSASYLDPPVERLDGPPTGEGDDWLRVGPVKLFFDGAPACAMCVSLTQAMGMSMRMLGRALSRGSLESMRVMSSMGGRMEGMAMKTGELYHPHERASALVDDILDHGFDVAVHAIGNEAISQAVDVLADADHDHIRRIEHAGVIDEEDVPRLVDAGIDVVTQPGFLSMPSYEHMVPISGVRLIPVRSFLDAGGRVVASSDTPVIDPDPMIGVRKAVTRTVAGGDQLGPEEAVDLETALALYTREPAELLDMPGGVLEPGRPADIVVLSPDPFDDLDGARVERTIMAGGDIHR